MRVSQVKRSMRHGFSLIELSIVMVIVGTVATLGLESAATFLERSAQEITEERIKTIDKALVKFHKVHGRLPCPGGRTVAVTDAGSMGGYGLEYCHATLAISSTSLRQGMVPVRTLNLPLEYAVDGYGSKFNYVVTTGMTATATYLATGDGISVRTGKLNTSCSTGCNTMGTAAFLVVSPGYDRRGGVSERGTPTKNCINGTSDDTKIDAQNCAFAGTNSVTLGVTGVTPDVFYDSRYNRGFNEQNYFDDIVIWRPKNRI